MQNQQSSPYQHVPGLLNLGANPIGSYDYPEEVPLPLPSKDSILGKKIISTLLHESEALTSKTQFNFQPTDNDLQSKPVTSSDEKQSDLQRSHTVIKHEVRNLSSVNKGEFESKLLGSPNTGLADRMNCATLFDKQYLLLGNDAGLFVMDFSVRWESIKPKQLLRGCPFKKLQVLDDYGVMIAIAGKRQLVRVYKLDSLLHLIKFPINPKSGTPVDFSKVPPFLKKISNSLPKCDTCGHLLDENRMGDRKHDLICPNCKHNQDGSDSNTDESNVSQSSSSTSSGKFHRRQLSSISVHLSDFVQHHVSNSIDNADISAEEKATVWSWATDYVKLPEATKGCVTFDIKETKSYVYLTVVTISHSILLFSCSVESKYKGDCKFEFMDSYFVPKTPNFINVSTDSFTIKRIIVGMEDCKAAVIDCYTNTVTELNMTKDMIPRGVESPRWMSFTPIPYSCSLDFIFDNPIEPEPQKIIISLTPNPPQISTLQQSPTSLKSPSTQLSPISSNSLTISNTLRRSHTRSEKRRSLPGRPSSLEITFASDQPLSNDRLKQTTVPLLSPKETVSRDSEWQKNVILAPQHATGASTSSQTVEVEKPFSENVFLCTISNVSHIVNICAEPYSHSRPIHWTSEPNHISLLPTIDDILVIAFENQLVEVGSMKTGRIVKKEEGGASIKYLGESWRNPIPPKGHHEPKKDKFDGKIRRYVFWSSELGDETYIYRGGVL